MYGGIMKKFKSGDLVKIKPEHVDLIAAFEKEYPQWPMPFIFIESAASGKEGEEVAIIFIARDIESLSVDDIEEYSTIMVPEYLEKADEQEDVKEIVVGQQLADFISNNMHVLARITGNSLTRSVTKYLKDNNSAISFSPDGEMNNEIARSDGKNSDEFVISDNSVKIRLAHSVKTLSLSKPRFGMNDVISVNKATISKFVDRDCIQRLKDWGVVDKVAKGMGSIMLFEGLSGVGKTMMAEAVAKELGLDYMLVTSGDINQPFHGDSEKILNGIFQFLKEKDFVLIMDESDSMLQNRSSEAAERHPWIAAETNTLMRLIEEVPYDRTVIMTTNNIKNIDPAFERRIIMRMKFELPTQSEREKIWRSMVPKECPTKRLNYKKLSEYKISGGIIKNVFLIAAKEAAADNVVIDMKSLIAAIDNQLKNTVGKKNAKPIGFQ